MPPTSLIRKPPSGQRLAAALLLALAQPALAEPDDESMFSVSGFATLGAVYHENGGQTFQRDLATPHVARSGQLNFQQDSMLGVQVTARPSPTLQGTVQMVSRDTIGDGYMPQVTWAYAKYTPVDEFSARLGRLGIELYLQGDSAEIGYANLRVRQQAIFYPRTMDGVDAEVTLPAGDGTIRLKGMAGATIGKIVSNGTVYDTRDSRIVGGLVEYANGPWTARWSAGRLQLNNAHEDPSVRQLYAAIAMTPNGAAINRRLSLEDRPIQYNALAFAYDSGPLTTQLTLVRESSPQWSDTHTLAALAGYRLGTVTPYVAYTRKQSRLQTLPTGIPDGLSPATDALNQAARQAQGSLTENHVDIALGLRHDFARNMALKLQADHFHYLPTYQGQAHRRLTLLSMALEVVF